MITEIRKSILENPKISGSSIAFSNMQTGLLTRSWRKTLLGLYCSLIPSHIDRPKQIFLDSPESVHHFLLKLRNSTIDLSSIEYICIFDTISDVYDIIELFTLLRKNLPDHAKIIYSNYNWFWYPIFFFGGLLGLSRKRGFSNFYRDGDLDNFAAMSGWEHVRKIRSFFIPCELPLLGIFLNRLLPKIPILRNLTLNTIFIARKKTFSSPQPHSVTVLIPCKNEEGNIEALVKRIPSFGKAIEILFVNDQSDDATAERILHFQSLFPTKNIVLVQGKGLGKAEAIRTGMQRSTGDICMILDADLTVVPEDLPQFYEALNNRVADFIHGTRFVYPQDGMAMRYANIIGNIIFSLLFTYIIEQRTTDTLCGTKVFWRKDWPIFEEMRTILKRSDLWGDYNLIFGAAHYGLKIGELPVRYFERLEGITKMNKRLKNGLIMLRVAWHALWNVKFRKI